MFQVDPDSCISTGVAVCGHVKSSLQGGPTQEAECDQLKYICQKTLIYSGLPCKPTPESQNTDNFVVVKVLKLRR